MRHEATQGRKASHDSLYSLEVSNWSHAGYGRDFLRVGFNAAFRDYESQEHASGDPEHTLLGVELDALLSKAFEGYPQVIHEILSLAGFDHDVVYVGLDGLPDVVAKDLGHAPLVRGTCVSEAKGHRHVAVHAKRCDERSRELVGLFHLDLMVTRVRIEERQGLAPCGGINDLIDSG